VGNREDRISLCSPGLPPTHYEAQAWLNLMIVLPQSPKFWDYKCMYLIPRNLSYSPNSSSNLCVIKMGSMLPNLFPTLSFFLSSNLPTSYWPFHHTQYYLIPNLCKTSMIFT
jgi:hypothetical protein